jgi:hypothetical protein
MTIVPVICPRALTLPMRSSILAVAALATCLASPAAGVCAGDCDGNGTVAINELIRCVSIALGQAEVEICSAIDTNGMGDVSISELIAAVRAGLDGCPGEPSATPALTHTPLPTATPTATSTVSPTPTATANQPPVLPTASIYRTFPGFPIRIALNPTDPEGGAVSCAIDNLPDGATFEEETGVLTWTPTEQQLGPFYVPYACRDDTAPPAAAEGMLTFKVSALDACTIPTCDPATGCTWNLAPLSQPCCAGGPLARVAEPAAGCPAGRVLYLGQNAGLDTFGRLQNCDVLVVKNFQQSGAEVQFNVETRCLSTLNRIGLTARMDSTAANHAQVFNIQAPPFLFAEEDDGYARRRGYRFTVGGEGPFFDMEGAEANLTVTLTDSDEVPVSQQVRVRLSFTPRPDLPDVDPTPPPTPTRTPP